MKLVEVQVQKFRNVVDSTAVEVQGDVTCLVGKNESGKSAFLEALYLLKPRLPNASFDLHTHYPAWLIKRDRMQGVELEKVTPIRAVFELEKEDREAIDSRFGAGAFKSKRVTVSREYSGKRWFTFETDEQKAVTHAVAGVTMPDFGGSHLAIRESHRVNPYLLPGLLHISGIPPAGGRSAAPRRTSDRIS